MKHAGHDPQMIEIPCDAVDRTDAWPWARRCPNLADAVVEKDGVAEYLCERHTEAAAADGGVIVSQKMI